MPDGGGLRLFETRNATIALSLLIAVYLAGYVFFYPSSITIADEGSYIRQAQLMLEGSTAVPIVNPFTGEPGTFEPVNDYPLGTALLLVPFVAAGGPSAVYWPMLVCTILGVIITGRWLYEQGRSPLWAALVIAYPATMVMGRVAMSEAPSLLLAATGLWLFWRGLDGSRSRSVWLVAGFVAGLSFAFRESNALLFAPLFAGALLRRERGLTKLIVGGVLGLGVRAFSAWLFFGDPLLTKPSDEFSLDALPDTLPTYLFSLLVLVPGGLVAAFAYRGNRRPEVISTVAIFVSFYLLYGYSAETSGWAKRLVLGPRYFIPLLPLLSWCAADVWPRLSLSLVARLGPRREPRVRRVAAGVCLLALLLLAPASVAVQRAHGRGSFEQATIREAIRDNTENGSVIVTNWRATGKFIDLVHGRQTILRRESASRRQLDRLIERSGSFQVVLLDRNDSAFWRRNAMDNRLFMASLDYPRELLLDLEPTPTDRLRIWRIGQ
jgi:4-amino-4-deoxy-L-arabinose transferase-like glycosyltransferase